MALEIKVAPSIFAADFYDLKSAVALMEESGVYGIHYDVMDNNFVPNISFGAKLVEDISAKTKLIGDAHLMINLETPIESFLKLPVENITIHLEATRLYIKDYLELIRRAGKKAALSLKPRTPVESVLPYLNHIDMVLLMSVEPGFSGQKFMPEILDKTRKLRELIGARSIDIQIDGGISRENYREVIYAGANYLVIGSAFFKDNDPVGWMKDIRQIN